MTDIARLNREIKSIKKIKNELAKSRAVYNQTEFTIKMDYLNRMLKELKEEKRYFLFKKLRLIK